MRGQQSKTGIFFISICVLAAINPTIAQTSDRNLAEASTKLDGWDQYRFGMTPDQVKAIPGLSWTELKPLGGGRAGVTGYRMDSQPKVTRYNLPFGVVAFFDAEQKLAMIHLTGDRNPAPREQCEREFQQLLLAIETQYGPLRPEQSLSAAPDVSPPREKISRDTRNLPGGKSQYEYDADGPNNEGGFLFAAQAVRDIGTGRIMVEALGIDSVNENFPCGSFVEFARGD